MRIGILEMCAECPSQNVSDRLYRAAFTRMFASVMPQAIAAWGRELGHRVSYAIYNGEAEAMKLLPDGLDLVFIASYTHAAPMAYAVSKLYRARGIRTVIGGAHARAFPVDCLRFFDIVVQDCDKQLVAEICQGHYDPGSIVSSGRALKDLPTVEQRLEDIMKGGMVFGRPLPGSSVALLASTGCPYTCDFCVDWDNPYTLLPTQRLEADLRFLSEHMPHALIIFQDPNFAVRFDDILSVLEKIPPGKRNGFVIEASLSILRKERLKRLKDANCYFVAPSIESWADYSNKAGVGRQTGRPKFERVVAHVEEIFQFISGMHVGFLLGTDTDAGDEPWALTKEFIARLPHVWPVVNIPIPYGATPLFDRYLAEDRILSGIPFNFYYFPYLITTLKNYSPIEYYDRMIDLVHFIINRKAMARRVLTTKIQVTMGLHHLARATLLKADYRELLHLRTLMAEEPSFRALYAKRSREVPAYFNARFERRLGRYASLLSPAERTPDLTQWSARKVKTTQLRPTAQA